MQEGIEVLRRLKYTLTSFLASFIYNYPSRHLTIVGVTGTDGKTTTANLIYEMLRVSHKKVGIVSTINAKIAEKTYDTGFHVTNPGPFQLQRMLSEMRKQDCRYVVLEVTSHGLDQKRVFGIDFEVSVLTNITHEHLDYHKSFENYVKTKAKLLNISRVSVINKRYLKLLRKYLLRNTTVFLYDERTLRGEIKRSVIKRFGEPYNVLNATAAVLVAKKLGVKDRDIIYAISHFAGVEGRMQEVVNGKGIKVIIDFAHTPNALENILRVLRKATPKANKLIAVFGCAGERDRLKRPMMGKISTDLADISVFTAEDPRNEKVEDIMRQMVRGVRKQNAKIYKIPERGRAISFAIQKLAKRGDTVVICGKGHEKSMNISGVERPWSDLKAIKKALRKDVV